MRKKAVILVVGMLVIALTACGKNTGPANTEDAVVSEETDRQEPTADVEEQENTGTVDHTEKKEGEEAGTDLSDRSNADTGEGEPKILAEGDIAPDFSVELVDGSTFRLSDYDDKTVIINFWATWCGPCVGEMPAFEMLKKDENEDLGIICVNCMEDQNTVDQFVKENGYTFPIGYDVDGRVLSYYPTQGIPYTLIVKKGIISKIFVGAQDAEYQYTEYKNAIAE